jgi:hypothetical protein
MAYSKERKKEIIDYICEEIEKGRPLRKILKEEEMPSSSTFFEWIDSCEEKAKQYARATEIRASVIFEDILTIADQNQDDTYINEDGKEVVNNDVIQRSRLRIDARKWYLSKLNPKKYGDKTDITSGGEKISVVEPVTFKIAK